MTLRLAGLKLNGLPVAGLRQVELTGEAGGDGQVEDVVVHGGLQVDGGEEACNGVLGTVQLQYLAKSIYSDTNESLQAEKINFDLLQILFGST